MVARGSLNEIADDVLQCWILPDVLDIAWHAFVSGIYHDIWLCCVSVPVLVAGFLTSISWHAKCIGNIWYVFSKFSEVMCLPFLTSGLSHMGCYLEFPVFQRHAIIVCPIGSIDFVIFLVLNDFLNVAKRHLNTFFFKVLVAFF